MKILRLNLRRHNRLSMGVYIRITRIEGAKQKVTYIAYNALILVFVIVRYLLCSDCSVLVYTFLQPV